MSKSIIHASKAFRSFKKSREDLGEHILEYYGLFWTVQEILHRNKNKILLTDLQNEIDNYCPTKIPIEDIISLFTVEEDYIYSTFQRTVINNNEVSRPKRIEAGELKQELIKKDALIKRLEEKIEFLKNPKPMLKKKIVREF